MVLSMEKWHGKVAIVTGASTGIGEAVVKMLLRHKMMVVGLARRPHLIEVYKQDLPEEEASHLHSIKCDMRQESDILSVFADVLENIGPVSVLINNAGISHQTTLSDGDTEMWRSVLETNVLGVSIATREAIKQMKANDIDGHIVHNSSVLGHYVAHIPNLNMYSASKHAVRALVETLRQELLRSRTKIRITSVSPGPVDTAFLDDIGATDFPKLQPEDVADAFEYVLSTPPHVQVQDVMIRPLGEPV
ncbi:farnesol dehydrogenase-like [Atheta coriaria]|uniref:farnesol dehydrogenase-like n=1 Tax=Dalotia coriaria TaxID=877792 RepID=UPI0031F3A536